MNGRADNLPLGDLLSALCEGQARPQTIQELERRLRDDPAARQEYLDYLLVHGILLWDYSSSAKVSDGAKVPDAVVAGPEDIAAAAARSPILGFLGDLVSDSLADLSRARFSLWLLLATAVVSSAITAALGSRKGAVEALPVAKAPPAAVSPHAAPPNAGERPAHPARAIEFVATLVGAADARWAGAEPLADGTRLPAGEVRLTEGLAEIVFDGGAKVVLQGPARFVPQSSRGANVALRRLVAHCQPVRHNSPCKRRWP